MLPGVHELTARAPGFRTATRENVTVTINAVTRVDLRLELGGVTEQITVAATVTALQTDTSDVRAEIASREMT